MQKLLEMQQLITSSGADVKLVEKENLHFNIKFFGDRTEYELQKISAVTSAAVKDRKQFEVELAGMGVFPNQDFVRVVWIGVRSGEEQMVELAQTLDKIYSSIGIAQEQRPFQAHITLCRVRSKKNIEQLREKITASKDRVIGRMLVNELVLYGSELTPSGPLYSELERFRLSE